MRQEYIRGLNTSSLLLDAPESMGDETDSIEMFRYNEIPCFLQLRAQAEDGRSRFCYEITGKLSLDRVLETVRLDGALLESLLSSLDQACMQAREYMLCEDDICLKPEFVFSEGGTRRIFYCYVPGYGQNIRMQFQEWMEYLLTQVDHKDEYAVQLAYRVYQRVTQEETALHAVLVDTGGVGQQCLKKDMTKEAYEQPVHEVSPEKEHEKTEPAVQDTEAPVQNKREKQPVRVRTSKRRPAGERFKKLLHRKIYTDSYEDDTEDIVYEAEADEEGACHPTVCLSQADENTRNQFIYQGLDRTRDFCCAQGKAVLGSSGKEADICIPLPMVSRIHASVEVAPDGTYVEDLNSTNGTTVNGELLRYREKRKLQKGDMLGIAGETYSFH